MRKGTPSCGNFVRGFNNSKLLISPLHYLTDSITVDVDAVDFAVDSCISADPPMEVDSLV